jgi:hypothetical protein
MADKSEWSWFSWLCTAAKLRYASESVWFSLSFQIRKRRCIAGWNKEWKRLVRLDVRGEETQSSVLTGRSEFAVTERRKVQGCDRHSSFNMPSHIFEGPSETRLVKVIVSFGLLLSQASCFLYSSRQE